MERELISKNEQVNKGYYKLEFDGQNVEKSPSFKKWYENTLKKIKIENKRRIKDYFKRPQDSRILCIFYCRKCTSYVICSYKFDFCCVECNKCKTEFCPACFYIRREEYDCDNSTCLKGYWKLWWLRAKNCRSGLAESFFTYYITHIILCIFFTPLLLGFITFYIGFTSHPKVYTKKFDDKICSVMIYSLMFGLLMFPYITILTPIMFLILVPSIFSCDYYIYIFTAYTTLLNPGYLDLRTYI